ncbi:MAG: hypothetical protein KME06_11715 [Kastovskya adunca ATA6-11-RM4]|jgi:hypothetical protein|nr:hypothetical protein [Kastovskya adunca ATA6-11-RM4]
MSKNISANQTCNLIKNSQFVELSLLISKLRSGIWLFGIPSWLFGIADRSVALFSDGYISPIEVLHLFTASFFFMGWLSLKPETETSLDSSEVGALQSYQYDSPLRQHEVYLSQAQARMLELKKQHLISQEYILPVPYICQIYHLLNLKHLETVHNFSLNNLKVIKVSQLQPTTIGGKVKFQTVLVSPFNALRIWRQPIVEVELILHTPYTVELRIPVYNNKKIIVIFNALPLNNNEHRFLVDIYSNLEWPKPMLQGILHFAACLTLFEDLPYLHQLAQRNIQRLFNSGKGSNQETMWLFRRFVDLYGASLEGSQQVRAIEAEEIDESVLSSSAIANN